MHAALNGAVPLDVLAELDAVARFGDQFGQARLAINKAKLVDLVAPGWQGESLEPEGSLGLLQEIFPCLGSRGKVRCRQQHSRA
jgi:hypothetical protein